MLRIVQITILFITAFSFAQREEASNWYFGEEAGLHFNLSTNAVTVLRNGSIDSREGSTSISDSSGLLLFYTDGHTVWNKNHLRMSGGWQLSGDSSNTQPALIVPKPDDIDIYYIFTTSNSNGLDYAIVDMSRENGLGAVINQNLNLFPFGTQMISAVAKDCAEKSIWVVAFSGGGNLSTYEVNSSGIHPATSYAMNYNSGTDQTSPNFGYLKFSPDGTKLACSTRSNGLFLFDFDTSSGRISNERKLKYNPSGSSFSTHGLEFSANSQILYVSMFNDYVSQSAGNNNNPANHTSALLQFDLSSAIILPPNLSSPIILPPTTIASQYVVEADRPLYRNGLQLATNGKIYRALSNTYNEGTTFLGVINNPNIFGPGCNYNNNAINMSSKVSGIAMPTFIQTFFRTHFDIIKNDLSSLYLSLCSGETYTLTADNVPGATYAWTLNGNLLSGSNFDLVVSQPGHYEVIMDMNDGYCPIKGEAHITYFQTPIANTPSNLSSCSTNNGIASFDLRIQNSDVLGTQDPLQYNIGYYETQSDADNNINEIINIYDNNESPQEIFVRIENNDFTDCYDVTSFFIETFNAQIDTSFKKLFVCDDTNDGDHINGQVEIDLQSFNSSVLVLGNQNVFDFIVTYHSNQTDAISKNNPLPNLYYNQNPYAEEIFVRVENKLDTSCFDTGSFIFNITMPVAFNTNLVQCDDEIVDGLSLFNLNEANTSLTGNNAERSTKFFLSLIDAQNSTNEIQENSFKNTSNPQIIYVQVIDDISGCYNISELTLEVGLNNFYYVPDPICDYDGIEDGITLFNLKIAQREIINSLSTGSINVFFFETYNNALLEQNDLGYSFTNTKPYSQTIYVRIENNNKCYSIGEVILTVNGLPNIETEQLTYYCLNTFPQTILLNAGSFNDSPTNFTYNWSTGEDTYEIGVNEIGVYSVTITNTNGCSKLREITVESSNTASFEAIEVIDASKNNKITILVSGDGIYEYSLINENNIIVFPFQESNTFENISPGIYTITVRDIKNNCGIVQNKAFVIGFPKFFTPNNDGVNDTWHLYGVTKVLQPNTKVLIFNRYGMLIKQLESSDKGWDGKFNGEKLPVDDYWFMATLKDGRIFKNHFTLKY